MAHAGSHAAVGIVASYLYKYYWANTAIIVVAKIKLTRGYDQLNLY
jgi:hypothetical protein